MLVTDVYVFVFMFDCLMTFYDCPAMTHWPWSDVEQQEDHGQS